MKKIAVVCAWVAMNTTGCLCNPSELIAEKLAETAIEKALENAAGADGQKVDIDLSSGQMKISSEKGDAVINAGEGASIPANFPKDVTVPAKIKVSMAMATPDGHLIAFSAERKASDVAAEVAAAMTAAQWKQNAQMDMGQQKILVYEKDNRTASYTIAQTDNAETCGGQITVATKNQ